MLCRMHTQNMGGSDPRDSDQTIQIMKIQLKSVCVS